MQTLRPVARTIEKEPSYVVNDNEPTAEELAEQEADSNWMEGLTQSHTGKKLTDYLGHLTSVLDDGNLSIECPIDQACSFRRVLIRALERRETPFGLPKRLPKFIAMVQLCGERMLLTTERTQLFQLMAHAPSGTRANSDAIGAMMQMIKYRDDHPDCSLLLTYSAPFQVSLEHLWWDVRTLRRDASTFKVIDGEMAYQIGESKCRAIGSTAALESDISAATLEKEIEAFRQHLGAVDLDVELLEVDGTQSSDAPTSKKVEALERVLSSLTQERTKMMKEHKTEIKELKDAKEIAVRASSEAAKMAYETEREQEDSLNREVNRLAKEVEASIKACATHKLENEQLRAQYKSDTAASVIRKDEEIRQLKTKISALEAGSKQAAGEATRYNKAREAALKKQETAHQKSLDAAERKLGKVTMAERAARQEAEDNLGKLAALSTAMEGRDSENELLEHRFKQVRTCNKVMKGLLALAANRLMQAEEEAPDEEVLRDKLSKACTESEELKAQMKVYELSAGASKIEIKKLKRLVGDREEERNVLGDANARLQQKIDELGEHAPDAPSSTQPVMADAETMTVPITSEADLRLGEEIARCVKLQDELEAKQNECVQVKAELAKAKSKAGKKGQVVDEAPVLGVPPSQSGSGYNIVTNVHVGQGNGNAAVASTDLGHAPDVDPAVEHMIAQAASHLRVLADVARDSARHKAAACEGWAQARALQNYTGYQIPQQQWQQVQMHHQPSPNGYHGM